MDQGDDEPSEDFQSESHVDHSTTEDNRSTDLKKRKLPEKDSVDVPSSSHVQSVPLLPSWVAGGSPPQFVAANELLQMSVAMDNLALVHEIAIDPEFSVSDIPKNPIQAAIKENMYRAYWDLLSEDLAKDPPDYTHAFNLLMEIKQVGFVYSLRNKMEQDCLDVHGVGRFIVDLLGRLCAPERDTLVEKLRHEDGIVEMIKGIFGLIDIMKNDLTNYTISKNRAAVEQYSSRFEYKEFMNIYDGSLMTKEWLKIAYHSIYSSSSLNSPPSAKREKVDAATVSDEEVVKSTSRGYLRLIESENPSPYPETLRIDKMRLAALAEKFLQMNIVTSALFITCSLAGKQISESEDFKNSLKDQLIIITNDIEEKKVVASCLFSDLIIRFRFVSMLFRTLTENLEAVCEQCVVMVRKRAETLAVVLSVEHDQSLREQMKTIVDKNNKIRKLVCTRISTFVEEILQSPAEVPRRLLPGLSVVQGELRAFTARYTALGLGILWGAYRYRQICEYHADIREWEHEKAVAKAVVEAKEKKWFAKDEMRYLIDVVNLPFEEGITQLGVADLFREE
ncbi:unnamed protein product [Angiostrongylus costaricensis]|uniref:ATP synthase subunit e, mitochondrial n=1 Tax=Angiostrongylus costaricensis TaxID=334426 RepID=A0A158PKH8_ANGCS|nr:unnamed protein product [Angiostrongylus costaricensis]